MIDPYLLKPKASCVLSGKSVWAPTLFDWDGRPVQAVNHYFRHLAYTKQLRPNTLLTFATPIQMFWKHLYRTRPSPNSPPEDWRYLTNETVRVWRNTLQDGLSRTGGERKSGTIADYRDALFGFLYWAHREGYMMVPMDDPAAPELAAPGTLSVHEIGINHSPEEMLAVPTEQEIEHTLAQISAHSGPREVTRNQLMFRWASEAGLRNSEIRLLRKRSLPTRAQIAEWRRTEVTPTMEVEGKGCKRRTIEPPLTLLEDTYSHLDDLEHVADPRWLANKKVLFPNEVGGVLSRTYVSRLFAGFFHMGGFDLHLHRARAYYVYRLIAAKVQALASNGRLDELHIATILRFAADRIGHADVKTLRYYVQLSLLRLRDGPTASLDEEAPLLD